MAVSVPSLAWSATPKTSWKLTDAERDEQQHDRQAQADVAHAVDDEGLLAGRRPQLGLCCQKLISR